MIRRDRNHPSVILWETALNESRYPVALAKGLFEMAHAEYPGDQMYTAGDYFGHTDMEVTNVCLGESLLVRLAVQLRDAGKTAGQIAATLEHAKEHLHLLAVIDDLKYLRKGGRLPAAVAVAGGMLGIKPLITIKEGKVVMAGKARGLPGAYVALFKKIEELGGISTCADALAGYTLAPREVQPIQTYLQENLGRSEALVRQIGCVIGTHAGPGAFGLAFLDEGFTF